MKDAPLAERPHDSDRVVGGDLVPAREQRGRESALLVFQR
jgi:hypothetical protein